MKKNNYPLQLVISDYDRLLSWAQELSKGYCYNKSDAALALKIKLMRQDFVSLRHKEYKEKKCRENSTTMN